MQSRMKSITAVIVLIVSMSLAHSAVYASPVETGENASTVWGCRDCVDTCTPVAVKSDGSPLKMSYTGAANVVAISYDVPINNNRYNYSEGSVRSTAFVDTEARTVSNTSVHSNAEDKSGVRVIVMFKDKTDTELIKEYQGEIKRSYKIIPAVAAVLPEKGRVYALVRDNPCIAYIEPDYEIQAMEDLPWGVNSINAELVWNGAEGSCEVVQGKNAGSGIDISVIDTGIDYSHPELADNYKGGYDFVNDDADPKDDNGHGTHCAGIIAAGANGEGIVGIAPEANLYAIKALDSEGNGYISDVISGIEWSVKNNMKIISMSIGSTQDSTAFRDACDKAYNAGLLLVASTGNTGNAAGTGDTVTYPGKYDSVIAVAATDNANNRASFSGTGADVELAAPGVSIYSTYLDSGYAAKSGTSMACPHVAGTAALVWAAYSNYSNVQVRERLQETTEDLGMTGKDDKFGYGMINAKKAAYGATSDTTPPASIDKIEVSSRGENGIKWIWSNPPDVRYTMVFLNGIWMTNTTNTQYYGWGLKSNTSYEMGTHTVDEAGNVNTTWVNHTAKTEEGATIVPQSSTASYSTPLYYSGKTSYIKPKTAPVSNNSTYKRVSPVRAEPVNKYYTKTIYNGAASNNIYSFQEQGKSETGYYTKTTYNGAASNNRASFVDSTSDTGKERQTAIYTDYKYPRVYYIKSTNVTAGSGTRVVYKV